MTKYAIVANGNLDNPEGLPQELAKHDVIIAADGGLNHCHSAGITPHYIVGDIDSTDPKILEMYTQSSIEKYPKNKDLSDLEIAVNKAFSLGANAINIFSALELRMDHTLANMILALRYPLKLTFFSKKEFIFAVKGDVELISEQGQRISLFSIGEPATAKATGLKWPIDSKTIDKDFFSLSNICVADRVNLSVRSGALLVCLERREHFPIPNYH